MNLDERARRAAASIRQEAARVDTDGILDRVQGRGRRRGWLPAVAAAATAAVVILVVAVVLPQIRMDRVEIGPDPVVPGPSEPSAPGSETSDAAPGGVWQRVSSETFTLRGDSGMRAVAQAGGATVAVGRASDGPGIWWRDSQRPSEDPAGWRQVAGDLCGEASCELRDVTTFDDRFVVVGVLDGLAKVWWSDDGRDWTRVDLDRSPDRQPAGETGLTAVTAGPDGLVAFGSAGDGPGATPMAFTSPDGLVWSEVPVAFDQQEVGAQIVDAEHVGGGRVLAVGYVGDGTVLWENQDGTWTARHLSDAAPEFGTVTTFVSSLHLSDDGELLLVGSAFAGQEGQDGRIWRSQDGGETWEQMTGDLGGTADQRVTDLFHAGGSTVAVGWTGDQASDPRPAAWILSEDGWQPMDGGAAFAGVGAITAAVDIDGHSAVAVGTGDGAPESFDAAPANAALWTYSTAGDASR